MAKQVIRQTKTTTFKVRKSQMNSGNNRGNKTTVNNRRCPTCGKKM